ncbi:MAG: SBBP repeat-containing protein [Candidatus Omnitrophota bacterium]
MPDGESVESGNATFERPDQNTLNITAADNTVINFSSFNIQANETVNYFQPNVSSTVLNRILDSDPSQIYGSLNANGNIFLINVHGINFGQTAQVNVSSLVASTLDVSTNNFVNGNYILEHANGAEFAAILNEGNITANNVALIGSLAKNAGIITAVAGTVNLASGNKTTVSFDAMGLIQIEVNEETSGKVYDTEGNALADAVSNTGQIQAHQVFFSAKTADDIFENAVNHTGITKAGALVEENGVIKFVANNNIKASGTLEAEGGSVEITTTKSITVDNELSTKGDTTLAADKDITVSADITTDSGNLGLLADNDLDGEGSFNQASNTTIATTTYGDITIQSSGDSTIANINSAGELTLKCAGDQAIYNQQPDSHITTQGSFTIEPGVTVNANNTLYEVGGSLIGLGVFVPEVSTFSFVSKSTAEVRGSNTFYNLVIVAPGKVVKFDPEETQDILGVLILKGKYGELLELKSITPGSQWRINPEGETDIAYVLIQDSYNARAPGAEGRAPPLIALYSDSLGNNFNWDIKLQWTGQGQTTLWSDCHNWSSGTIPLPTSDILFDGNTSLFPNANKDSNIDPDFQGTIQSLTIDGYSGDIAMQRTLTINGNLSFLGNSYISFDNPALAPSSQERFKISLKGDLIIDNTNAWVYAAISLCSSQDQNLRILKGTVYGAITIDKASGRVIFGDFDLTKLPLYFVPNQGQVPDSQVKFYVSSGNRLMYFTPTGICYLFSQTDPDTGVKTWVPVNLSFLDASGNAVISPELLTGALFSYFLGNDLAQYHAGLPSYYKITYTGLYPGITLSISSQQSNLKTEYVVAPGIDYCQIKLSYENITSLEIDSEGNLIIRTSVAELTELKPYVYQYIDGVKVVIDAEFEILSANSYGFKLGAYNQDYALVIDPTLWLTYSTYLGGSSQDYGRAIAVDSSGCAYVTGSTQSADFPTSNAYQGSSGGSDDAFVTKFNSAGSALVYSTYLGGSDNDAGYGIAVDSSGCAYITGNTSSTDFPLQNAFQSSKSTGSDAFVTKFNSAGSALTYSTYLGGTGSGDYGKGIAVDTSSCAYVTGYTDSTDFPLQSAFQGTKGAGYDVFVTKFNAAGSALTYSTYLGGNNNDFGRSIAVDSSGCAYVTGEARSTDFPMQSAYQGTHGGGLWDAFVTKFNAAGSTLAYSTYLGGSGGDYGYGIKVDSSGFAYVTGSTISTNFPTQDPYQGANAGNSDAFLTKFNAAGSALVYSTYLGGAVNDYGRSIAIDPSGCAYVTGETSSSADFPTQDPYQGSYGGSTWDAFITKFNSGASALVYSTYLGGTAADYGTGIAVDSAYIAYVAGYTASTDFPTESPYQGSNGGNGYNDAFVAKLNFGISVSGTVYTNEGKTANVSSGVTIGLSVHGLTKTTNTTDANGAFTFYSVPVDADNTITLFVDDNGSYEANLVSQAADGTSAISVEMYTNKIVLRYESAGPMTNTLLNRADNSGDDDIHYTFSGSDITFDTGYEVWIDSGKTYTPGAAVSVDSLENNGTFNPEANAITVRGSWDNDGTFTSSGTVSFTTASSATIDTGGVGASCDFENLTVDKSGGILQLTGNHLEVDTTLTITAGTLDMNGKNITEADTISVTGTLKLQGSETTSVAPTNNAGSTIEYSATTAIKDWTYKSIKLNGSGAVFTLPGDITANENFEITLGEFQQGANKNLTVKGDFTIAAANATFTKGTGTSKLILDGSGTTPTFYGPTTPQNLGVVQIGASPGDVYLNADFMADSITVDAGDVFYTMGYEVDAGSGGITLVTGAPGGEIDTTDQDAAGYEKDGTIITCAGAFTINAGAVFTKCSTASYESLVKMDGGGAANFKSSSQDIGNFQISTANSNITLQDALNADDITIDGSTTLTAGANAVNCAGDWDNSGSFSSSAAVTLDGTAQSILGSTTFYDLTKTVVLADTLTFDSAGEQIITHDLTLNGADTELLSIVSNNPGTRAALTLQAGGTQDLQYLDVQDSDASAGLTLAGGATSTNSGNNLNWSFPIDIDGIAYAADEAATLGNGIDIILRAYDLSGNLLAGYPQTATIAGGLGEFSFSGVTVVAGGALVFYIDSTDTGGNAGNTYTITDATDIADMQIFYSHLNVRDDTAYVTKIPVTNTILNYYDNGSDSANMIFNVNAGAMTMENISELKIDSTGSFAPGGDVTTGITVADAGSDNLVFNLDGAWTESGASAETLTIKKHSDFSGSFTKGIGTVVFSNATQTINGTQEFNNVTFTYNGTGAAAYFTINNTLTVTGTLKFAGTYGVSLSTGTINAEGNIEITNTSTRNPEGTATIKINGDGNQIITGSPAADQGQFPGKMYISKDSGDLTLTDGTFIRIGSDWTFDKMLNDGQLIVTGSTVVFYSNLTITATVAGDHGLNNVTFATSTGADYYQPEIAAGTILTVEGNLFFDGPRQVRLNTGTIWVYGDVTTDIADDDGGGSALIVFKGANPQKLTGSGAAGTGKLCDIEIAKTNGTFTLESIICVDGHWTFTSIGAGSIVNTDSTVIFYGNHNVTCEGDITMAFNNVTVAGNTRTLTGDLDVDGALIIDSGCSLNNAGNHAINVGGNWDNDNGGTFTSGNATVTFDGPSAATIYTGGAGANFDFNNVIIDKDADGTVVQISGNLWEIDGTLTITQGVLYLNGQSITNSTGLSIEDAGTLRLNGSENIPWAANDINTGTWEYIGAGAGPYNIKDFGADDYHNLTINATNDSDIFQLTAALKVYGDLTIDGGELNVTDTDYQINVAGNWENNDTFTPEEGTVILDGSGQSILGSTTFYDLTKTVTAVDTLTFDSAGEQIITHTLTLTGDVGDGDLLSLVSSTPGTRAALTLQAGGTQVLSYLNVQDSDASGGLTLAGGATSTNSGNNLNWSFPIDIDGIAYEADEAATLGNGIDILLRAYDLSGNLLAGYPQTATITDGLGGFSFNGVTAVAGGVLVFYIDSTDTGGIAGNTFTITDATDIIDMEAFYRHLNIRDDTAYVTKIPVTNTILNYYDNGSDSANMIFNVNAGAMTMEATTELKIDSTGTFAPGGDVTTGTTVPDDLIFNLDGTWTESGASAETLTIKNDCDFTGGTFTRGIGTVKFTTSGTDITGSQEFYNLSFIAPNAVYAIEALTELTVHGTLTIQATHASNAYILLNGGTINAKRDITLSVTTPGAASNLGPCTATVNINGTVDQTITGTSVGDDSVGVALPNVNISKDPGSTLFLKDYIAFCATSWTYTKGTIDIATYDSTVRFHDADMTISGSLILDNVWFSARNSDTFEIVNTLTVNNLTISGFSGSPTLNTGTINVKGDIDLSGGGSGGGGTATIKINGLNIQTITGSGTANYGKLPNLTIEKLDDTGNLVLSSIISIAGNWIFNTIGANDTVVNTGSTVVFYGNKNLDGEGDITMAFNNVIFGASGGGTRILIGDLDVDGDLTINGSSILDNNTSGTFDISVGGDWSNSYRFISGAGTVTFDGGTSATLNSGGTGQYFDFNDIIVAKTGAAVLQLSGNTLEIDGTLTINDGVIDLNGQTITNSTSLSIEDAGTLRLIGTETIPWAANDIDTGTWEYIGGGSTTYTLKDFGADGGNDYYNLIINSSVGTADTFQIDGVKNLKVAGDFSLNSGTFSANGRNQNIAGDFSLALGALYTKGGTLTFDGATAASYTDSTVGLQNVGAVSLNKTDAGDPATNNKLTLLSNMLCDSLTVDGTGGSADTLAIGANTITATGATDLNGTLTISTGTFNADGAFDGTGGTITFTGEGNLVLSSTVTNVASSLTTTMGEVIYDGAAAQDVDTGITYHDLTIDNSGGFIATQEAGTLDINGDFLINDSNAKFTAANAGNIEVYGSWTNNGTFTANSGTVTLNGTSQAINGSTTFYNLTKSVAAATTLTLDNTATQLITHTLILNGDVGQLLSLRSDSTPNQFSITLQAGGTQTLSYLDVKDSDASGGLTLAAGSTSTNSGNNLNWSFPITITGTAYQANGTSYLANGKTIEMRAYDLSNNLVSGYPLTVDTADGSGGFTFSNATVVTGGILVFHIHDETENGNVYTITDGNSFSMNLLQNFLIIRSDSAAASASNCITNAKLDIYDRGQDTNDMLFTVTAGALTMDTSSVLRVRSSGYFTPGGNVTTGTTIPSLASAVYDLDGTWTETAGDTLTIQNTCTFDGTFTKATGKVKFNTGSDTSSIIGGTQDFYDVEFNNPTGSEITFSISNTLTVYGTLTQSGAGNVRLVGGAINAKGDIVIGNTGGTGDTTGSTTININGTTDQEIISTVGVGEGKLPAVTINKPGDSGDLTLTGIVNVGNNFTYTSMGNGLFVTDDSTLAFCNASITASGTFIVNNLTFYNGRAPSYTFNIGTITVNGTLTLAGSGPIGLNNGTINAKGNLATTNTNTNCSGIMTININGDVPQEFSGSATMGQGKWPTIVINKTDTLTLKNIISIYWDWTYTAGTVDATTNDSTVAFYESHNLDGQGAGGTMAFDNVTIAGGTRTLTGNLDVDGNLTINSGCALSSGNYAISVGGDWDNDNGGTFTSGNATVTFNHASAATIYTGGVTGNYDFHQNIEINKDASTTVVQLSGNGLDVDGTFTITKGIFYLNGQPISSGTTLSVTDNGTLRLNGNEAMSWTSNSTATGTWEYVGAGAGPYNIKDFGVNDYHNLLINASNGTDVFQLTAALNVDGDLTIDSGELNVTDTDYQINVAGNWENNDTFTAEEGAVVLDGAGQSILGSTTFYDLTKTVTSPDILTFDSTGEQIITHTLTLNGDTGDGDLLSIVSDNPGTRAALTLQAGGTQSLSYLDVQDSDASAGETLNGGATSDNSGNNLNWILPTDVSGTARQTDETDPIAGIVGILLKVYDPSTGLQRGGDYTDDTDNDLGTFTMTSALMKDGDILIIYIDGAAEDANTFTIADGSDMAGVDLYDDHLVIRNEIAGSTTPITNTILNYWDSNDDADMVFAVNSGALVMSTAKDAELYINSGDYFAPGGDVTTADGIPSGQHTLDLNGTWTESGASAETLTIKNDCDFTGGTFTRGIGTIIFSTASATLDIYGDDTQDFNNVTFYGGAATFAIEADTVLTVNGTLKIEAVGGTVYVYLLTGTINAKGDITLLISTGSTDYRTVEGTATININGAGDQTITGLSSSDGISSVSLPNVNISKDTGTLYLKDFFRVSGDTWTYTKGSLDVTTYDSTVEFFSGMTIIGTHALDNVTFTGNSVPDEIAAGTILTVNDELTIGAFNYVWINTGTIYAKGNITLNGLCTNNASGGSATIIINGAGDQYITGTDTAGTGGRLPNIEISKDSGILYFDNIITLTNYDGNITWTYTKGTVDATTYGSTVAFYDTTNVDAEGMAFDNIIIGGYVALASGLDADGDLTINSGRTLDNSGNYAISVGGDWDNDNGGTFTSGNATVTFDGASAATIYTGTTGANVNDFQNVIIDKDADGTVVQLSGNTFEIDGTLTITQGVLYLNGQNITNSTTLSIENAGTLRLIGTESVPWAANDFDTGTWEFVGAGSGTYVITDYYTHYFNLLLNSGDGTDEFQLGAALDVDGDLTIESGELNVTDADYQINVAGDWTNNDTFTAEEGAVVLDGLGQSILGSTTFYDLTKTVTAVDTLTFDNTGTQIITHTLTLTGDSGDGDLLSLISDSSPNQFSITLQAGGAQVLSYLDVKDSDASGGVCLAAGANSTNSGNNLNWSFPVNITGTAYQTNESSFLANGIDITLMAYDVNGVLLSGYPQTVQTAGGLGGFTFSGVPLAVGGSYVVYINGAGTGETGNTIGTTDASAINLSVMDDHIIIRTDHASATASSYAVTNSILSRFDNDDDTDMLYTVAAGDLTVEDGVELYINTGDFFTPAGNVTTGTDPTNQESLDLNGTWTETGTETLTINGDFDSTGGTFTRASGTVKFNNVSCSITGSQDFNNVEFYADTSSKTFTISGGTILTVNGTLTLSGATGITLNTGDIYTKGNISITNNSSSGGGSATITINGSSTQTITGVGTTNYLPKVTINKSGNSGDLVLSGVIRVGNDLTFTTIGNGLFTTAGSTVCFYSGISGETFDISGIFTLNNVYFGYTVDSSVSYVINDTLTIAGTLYLQGTLNLIINTGTINTQGNITISNTSTTGGGTATININGTGSQTLDGPATAGQGKLPNVTIEKDSGTLYLRDIISVAGDWTYTKGTIDIATYDNTVAFYGTHNLDGQGTVDTMAFKNVTFAGVTTLTGNLDVNNDLTIDSGCSLDTSATDYSINVGGDWINNAGAVGFTANESLVTLDGLSQAFTGSTTFYDLSKVVTAADTLTFDNTATQLITHTLTLKGESGKLLSLRSDSNGVQYTLTLQAGGTQDLAYLDVKDSDASSGLVLVGGATSTNSGNNLNWSFAITITGTAYQTNETSFLANGINITLMAYDVNGNLVSGYPQTVQTAGGSGGFTFSNIALVSGGSYVVYINDSGTGETGNTVGTTDASAINLSVMDDHIIIRTDHASATASSYAVSNSILSRFDNDDDADMLYTVAAGVLTVENGAELYINTGDFFTPAGNVNTGTDPTNQASLDLNGTWTETGTETLTINGDFDSTGGTFTRASGTVKFNNFTGSITGSQDFNNVEFTASSAFKTFTISAGTILTVNGTLTESGTAAIFLNTGDIYAKGNITVTNTTTWGGGSATITINGSSTQTIEYVAGANNRLPKVTINKPGDSGDLIISGGISVANDFTFTTIGNGSFTTADSKVNFYEGASGETFDISGTFGLNNVQFGAWSYTPTFIISGTLTLTGYLSISTTTGITFNVNDTINVSGYFELGGTKTITVNTGTINAGGAIFLTNTDTSGGGTATVNINGAGSQTLRGYGVAGQGRLPNVKVEKDGGTLYLRDTISVAGDWTYVKGTIDITTNDSTVVFYGTHNLDGQGSSATMTFDNVTFAGATTLTGNLNVGSNFSTNSGTLDIATYTATVSGATDLNDTLTISTGTFNADGAFDGTGATITFTGEGNLVLSSTVTAVAANLTNTMGEVIYDAAADQTIDTGITYHDLTINNSGIAIATQEAGTLNIAGNWTNNGIFNANNGTVAFTDISQASTIAGNTTFYNFVCETAGKTLTFTAGTEQIVTNDLTIKGAIGNTVTINDTGAGATPKLSLQAGKTQDIENVDVTNNDASSGQQLIADGASTLNGITTNWLLASGVVPPATTTTVDLTNILIIQGACGMYGNYFMLQPKAKPTIWEMRVQRMLLERWFSLADLQYLGLTIHPAFKPKKK